MDYKTLKAHKRARRAAMHEAGKKTRGTVPHRNKSRYSRRSKFGATYA
jgi:hypothetical protein